MIYINIKFYSLHSVCPFLIEIIEIIEILSGETLCISLCLFLISVDSFYSFF